MSAFTFDMQAFDVLPFNYEILNDVQACDALPFAAVNY